MNNICKFVPHPISSSMTVSRFVRESKPDIMSSTVILKEKRAILISEGEGEIIIDKEKIIYSGGMLFFAFEGESISVMSKSDTVYLYIDFVGARADELYDRFDIGHSCRAFMGFDGLIPLWSESLARASEKTVDLAAESVLLYTFSRMDADDGEGGGIIRRILKITEERFNDSKLSVASISAELFYNPKYISHLFKKKMGVSYSEYLNSLRIKYAITLFRHGIDLVRNVAALSGFSDPLYFSTVFKKQMGISPAEYRRREIEGIK